MSDLNLIRIQQLEEDCQAKDAEIERLKGICDTRLMHIMNVCHPLITELAEALKARNQLGDTQGYIKAVNDILQQAREATKDFQKNP